MKECLPGGRFLVDFIDKASIADCNRTEAACANSKSALNLNKTLGPPISGLQSVQAAECPGPD